MCSPNVFREVHMRTRPLGFTLVAAAVLSACATNPRVKDLEPEGPPAMRVWIHYPVGSSLVHPIFVNREAYVAMFEIVPGRGVTMVYPHGDASRFASDAHYADLAFQPGRMFYHTDPFGYANVQPRYYYVVASSAPLNLRRLRPSLGDTRRVLGRLYGSFRPYDVIDRLTELVVPKQADEDWATDLLVDWPFPPTRQTFLAHQWVRCANGRLILVAANYPYFGCPGDTRRDVALTSAKAPIKELPLEAVPRPPHGDGGRQGIELAAPQVESRRRAETSVQPPRSGGMARWPGREGIRYSEDGPSPQRRNEPSPPRSASPAPSDGSSGKTRSVDRREPRAEPAPRGESGKERKPDTL
jgi:hypothetical protein